MRLTAVPVLVFWGSIVANAVQVSAPIAPNWTPPTRPYTIAAVQGREAVADEVLVRFRDPTPEVVADVARANGVDAYKTVGRGDVVRMRFSGRDMDQVLASLQARGDVEFAEPNYIIRANQTGGGITPTDPSFDQQWALRNRSQSVQGVSGTRDADIDADLAWETSTGSGSIVVAIPDTGIDYDHPDLAANVWAASSAYVVTVGGSTVICPAGSHGYNAVAGDCDPRDDNGHGTFVSGIIGAVGNNSVGIAGVNWTVKLLPIKILDEDGVGTVADAIDGIEFALQIRDQYPAVPEANVRVLSNSWGGINFSQALRDDLEAAHDKGILTVAAAGNGGTDNDAVASYPSGFDVSSLIAVAATDQDDMLADFSQYGATTVDLGAPGTTILSTFWADGSSGYAYGSGTSVATVHVSGAAALILSACDLPPIDLKNLLLATVDTPSGDVLMNLPPDPSLVQTLTGGRLNVGTAMSLCDASLPTFTMNARPSRVTINRGEDAVFDIDIRSWFGFAGGVSLSNSYIPGTFSPSVVAGGDGSATLTIPTRQLANGKNLFAITASGGGVTRTQDIVLEVVGTPAPFPAVCGTTLFGEITGDDPPSLLLPGEHYQDQYAFDVTGPGMVTVFLDSPDAPMAAFLLDASENVLGSDVDGGPDLSAHVEAEVPPGTYVVEATTWAGADQGSYELTLGCPGDPVPRDDIIVDFGDPDGSWIWEDSSHWRRLHELTSESIVPANLNGNLRSDILMDFGPSWGIWNWEDITGWTHLHQVSPESIAAGDLDGSLQDEIIVDFGSPYGLYFWRRNWGWWQLHHISPELVVTGDLDGDGRDSVIADFGDPYGIWSWQNSDPWSWNWDLSNWTPINGVSPDSMTVADLDGNGQDDIVIDFGDPYGIWIWQNNSTWIEHHPISPESIVAGDIDGNGQDDIIVDFGDPYGIWIWQNNSVWVQLHLVSPESMAAGDTDGSGQDDIVIDFGDPYGIWIWQNNSTWIQLHHVSARSITIANVNGP